MEGIKRIGGIVEDGDTDQGGHSGFEQLKPFPGCLYRKTCRSRDVTPGTGKALDQASRDRVGTVITMGMVGVACLAA